MQHSLDMKVALTTIVLLGLAILTGCSSTKIYTSSQSKNVFITTTKNSGSTFSSIEILLDVYDINRACEIKYLGSIALTDNNTKVGLPVNKNSLLSFRFEGSSFLGGSSSSTSLDTLLKPRKGYQYDIHARYVNGIYNVDIHEFYNKRSKKRQIDTRELHECKS